MRLFFQRGHAFFLQHCSAAQGQAQIRLRVGFNQAGALPENNRGRERTRKFMGFARCGLGLVMADDKTILMIVGI